MGQEKNKKTAPTSKGCRENCVRRGKLSFSEDMETKTECSSTSSLLITDQEFRGHSEELTERTRRKLPLRPTVRP